MRPIIERKKHLGFDCATRRFGQGLRNRSGSFRGGRLVNLQRVYDNQRPCVRSHGIISPLILRSSDTKKRPVSPSQSSQSTDKDDDPLTHDFLPAFRRCAKNRYASAQEQLGANKQIKSRRAQFILNQRVISSGFRSPNISRSVMSAMPAQFEKEPNDGEPSYTLGTLNLQPISEASLS